MKIALSGAHSQGKTTILNELIKNKWAQTYIRVQSPTRVLASEGFNINEKGDATTQTMIMIQHFKNVTIFNNNSIFDRCALDGLAYSLFFEKDLRDKNLFDLIKELFKQTIKQYDFIFYIEPELAVKSDGTRSTDNVFFTSVVSNFKSVIDEYNIPVIRIKGSVEQRIELIHKAINI